MEATSAGSRWHVHRKPCDILHAHSYHVPWTAMAAVRSARLRSRWWRARRLAAPMTGRVHAKQPSTRPALLHQVLQLLVGNFRSVSISESALRHRACRREVAADRTSAWQHTPSSPRRCCYKMINQLKWCAQVQSSVASFCCMPVQPAQSAACSQDALRAPHHTWAAGRPAYQ